MSSVSYDPRKAHEYYERNKKLKGRRSTKGFNQTQKEQWAYAKYQINNDYKATSAGITEKAKAERAQLASSAKAKIDAIRNIMKGMSKEEKARFKDQIANIRAVLKTDKSNVTEQSKASRAGAKEQKEKSLDDALAKIKRKK